MYERKDVQYYIPEDNSVVIFSYKIQNERNEDTASEIHTNTTIHAHIIIHERTHISDAPTLRHVDL